jgi:hypothetical protein
VGARARRDEVLAMHRAGALQTPAQQIVAATLLLDSEHLDDVRQAEALALRAMPHDRAARPLAATAYDRLRRLAGQPQKFGTQVVESERGLALWPVDPATTDSERAKWGLPALGELQRNRVTP